MFSVGEVVELVVNRGGRCVTVRAPVAEIGRKRIAVKMAGHLVWRSPRRLIKLRR